MRVVRSVPPRQSLSSLSTHDLLVLSCMCRSTVGLIRPLPLRGPLISLIAKKPSPRGPSLASAHHLVYKSLKAPQRISLLCELLEPHCRQAPRRWASSMPLCMILRYARWEMEHLRSDRAWVFTVRTNGLAQAQPLRLRDERCIQLEDHRSSWRNVGWYYYPVSLTSSCGWATQLLEAVSKWVTAL
jgi:hypothetical protein